MSYVCPYCNTPVDWGISRCPHCTSWISNKHWHDLKNSIESKQARDALFSLVSKIAGPLAVILISGAMFAGIAMAIAWIFGLIVTALGVAWEWLATLVQGIWHFFTRAF
jgi:hypothetical protein